MLTVPGMVTVGCMIAELFFVWKFAITIFGIHAPGDYLIILTGGLVAAVIADLIVRRSGNTIAQPHNG